MSDSVDSAKAGGAAGDAPLTKPSLRVPDAALTGVTSREQDLADGPSLLGIGDGQGDPYTDLTWETTENYVPQAGVLSSLLFRLPQPGPTEVIVSHASNSHHKEVLLTSTDGPRINHSLYWTPEFSWQGSHLCFDDQPLELPETRDGQSSRAGPDSEHAFSLSHRSLPHIGGLDRGNDEFQISAIAGIGSFAQSETVFRGEFIEAGLPAHVEIAMQETIKNIVETLVDDYYRSYAPQKRTLAAKRKQADRSSSSSTRSSRASVARKGAKAGSRKGQTIDGDGGSEDEESSGNRQSPSDTDTSVENTLFWACPFMKWDPREHRHSCVKKLRDIHGLRKHIQEKQFGKHCPECFRKFSEDTTDAPPHPCVEIYDLPPRPEAGLITMDMQTAIKERPDPRMSQKEKWERLFKIVLRYEPIPSSHSLDHEMALVLCKVDDLFCRPSVQRRVRHMIHESQLASKLNRIWRRLDELVFERLVQWFLDALNANVIEMNARIASEEETVDHAQPISTMENGIPDHSYTLDSRGTGYDQNEITTIQSGLLIKVDDTTTPIPELFADQSEIGVGETHGRLEATDTYGLFCSDVAGNVTGNVNFEETGSDPFLRPAGGDLPWYSGQGMFETELDQMWSDQSFPQGT
ncbi:uncharacterized protein BKA55DRAFT_725712 [Fusarium redolens]|uniref:C2H2-type domain-containing protein n=1 Tax=Fusarium redolens TaxID=48865 RepID=A0A9P9HDV7_FUSRE|nr:uncharacterized protein BKA55DRAFT_725712 [Fusarium redolens]KAH7255441.1 hypothetical protein BKA55DRAFT_725712 [Fusarium redolens]